MQEVCYCGRRGDVEDREPIWRDDDNSALRCPECGHLDFLPQLDAYARRLVFGEAERRWLAKLSEGVQLGHGRKQVA